jgi:predicted small lipoprotein YifL
VLALVLLGLAGCGQMGPLYLPSETVNDETVNDDEPSDEENE